MYKGLRRKKAESKVGIGLQGSRMPQDTRNSPIAVHIECKPISVNAAFQGKRFKTPECKQYERDLWVLLPQRETVEGEIEVWLEFSLKNYGLTDVGNLEKVLMDILVKKGYIEDDRKVVVLHLSKRRAEKDMITIRIQSLLTELS